MAVLRQAIKESGFRITTLVVGGASGVDALARDWAISDRYCWHVHQILAEWDKYGRAAGPLRNERMAQNADALIAVWDGKSRGTKDMIERARKHGLKVYVKEVKQ